MDTKHESVLQPDTAHPPGTQVWFHAADVSPGRLPWRCEPAPDRPGKLDAESSPCRTTSSSPNDPLNWPVWSRDALLCAAGFNSFLAAALVPILAAGFTEVSEDLGVSVQQVSFTTGINMLGLGAGAVLWSPTATLFGKRPVYLSAAALLIASSAWVAISPTYASLVVARFIQGLAASPGEFLVSVTVSEIYLPHERGFKLGIYMLFLSVGKSLSPLFGAAVIQGLGWRWVMWISTIVSGICLLLLSLFGRETSWARDIDDTKSTSYPSGPLEIYTETLRISPALAYTETLKPWNGRLQHASWLSLVYKPLFLLRSPVVLWSAIVYALSLGWLAVLAETIAGLFEPANRYGFTPIQIGLLYISPLVGTVLGSAVGGKVSDMVACVRAYRNNGVYEPEFRLVLGIPVVIATTVGLAGYGWSIQAGEHWIVPTVCFGLIYFGCTLGATTAVTYCLDCHKPSANAALVIFSLFKNSHGLAFSLFVVDWVGASGARDTFLTIAGLHLAFLLPTVLMYIYGKRARVWVGAHVPSTL